MEVVTHCPCSPSSSSVDGSGDQPSHGLVRLRCPSRILGPLLALLQSPYSPLLRAIRHHKFIPKSQDVSCIVRVIDGEPREPIYMTWELRIHSLFLKYLELEKMMWTLSTLGGAYSAMADYDRSHARVAHEISLRQLLIARELQDPVSEGRCCLYLGLAAAQEGRVDEARKVARQMAWMGQRLRSSLLEKCARGVYAKALLEAALLMSGMDARREALLSSTLVPPPRFVPWEPFKAASGADRKGLPGPPSNLPILIPYSKSRIPVGSDRPLLVDERKLKEEPSRREKELSDQLRRLEVALSDETNRAEELRRMLTSTMNDDVVEYVHSLAEDKIRLARRIEAYTKKLAEDVDEVDTLRIERDLWRAKFLAMAVRADEEGARASRALSVATAAQRVLAEASPLLPSPLNTRAADIATRPIEKLFIRSPCDELVCRRFPNINNLTITCCSNNPSKKGTNKESELRIETNIVLLGFMRLLLRL